MYLNCLTVTYEEFLHLEWPDLVKPLVSDDCIV